MPAASPSAMLESNSARKACSLTARISVRRRARAATVSRIRYAPWAGMKRSFYPRHGPRYNESAMKLEIEVDVAGDAADKLKLQEHLRKEAILALFADRKMPAGKAAHDLGLTRIAFMELLQRRDIPYA